MQNQSDITVGLKAVGAAMNQADQAARRAANAVGTIFAPDAKNTPTRRERRAADRAHMADQTRNHRGDAARNIANDRGTLPDAKELFRVHQARKTLATLLGGTNPQVPA